MLILELVPGSLGGPLVRPPYLSIAVLGRADPGNLDLGDDQEVDRSLGGDVSEGQTLGERQGSW